MESKEFTMYAMGMVYASVCTSLSLEQATEQLNVEAGTGLAGGWIKADEDFRTGESNPCPCHDHPETHRHYLFVC